MKDPNATITLTASYTLTNEAVKKYGIKEWCAHDLQRVDIELNTKEALRAGYISYDSNYDRYVSCPENVVLGELRPNPDKVGVLREVLPVFDHTVDEHEAANIVAKQMARYDEVLALSKAENEKRQKPKPSENSPRVTLVGRYLLTPEALQTVRARCPQAYQEQTVLISVDAKEALRTGYTNEKNEYNHFVLCKLEPDLKTEARVLRGPKIPEFDHILSEEEAAEIVTNEMARYNKVLSVSLIYNNKKQTPAKSHPKKRPVVELRGKYWLTREAHEAINLYGSRIQTIEFNLDAEEAIRTGYATLDGRFGRGDEDSTFSKLEPDLDREGVLRRSSRNEFDHVLTASEAATIVTAEMKRYDEVLGVSQKIQELKAKYQSTTVVLVGAYLLTKEAHENLALSGVQTTRKQRVPVVLDAKEAVRAKYATIDKNGRIVSLRAEDVLFQKIEPYPPYYYFDHILTVEEATKIVTDEMTRFDEVSAASKAEGEALAKEREETWAKERADQEILSEKRQKAKDAFLAELRCYVPRIVDGDPCVIDSNERGAPAWLEMDGKRIDVRYDLLDSQECEAVKKTLLGEWRKRTDAEIAAWIEEHGSARLKKAVEAGLLSQIRGAYRSERLAIELPGWMFLSEEEQDHIKERLNPSEDEIDAFVEAKKKWPEGNVRLSSVRVLFKAPAFEGWASFLVMKCPFHNALIGRICLHSNENDAAGAEAAETSSKSENPKNPTDEIKEDPLEK